MSEEHQEEEAIREGIERIAAAPGRLARAVAGRTAEELRAAAGPDAWSASAILAHVRASDDILAYRLYAILARDNPLLLGFDERRWAAVAGYDDADFQASLTLFTLRRAELVRMLRRAPRESWQRTGVHELHGARTLLDIATTLVAHEEEHCGQLEAIRSRADD